VAILVDLSNQAQASQAAQQDAAAEVLGLKLQRLDVRGPSDLDAALDAITRERAQALYVYPLQVGRAGSERIMDFAAKHRLPTMTGGSSDPLVQARVLLRYSYSIAEHNQRAANYVDRILKGANPGDLPVEQPTKFELVINLKTAKALGLTIPPALLLRADHVIE
jgi:putative ABC transport system substrate-binding protein